MSFTSVAIILFIQCLFFYLSLLSEEYILAIGSAAVLLRVSDGQVVTSAEIQAKGSRGAGKPATYAVAPPVVGDFNNDGTNGMLIDG